MSGLIQEIVEDGYWLYDGSIKRRLLIVKSNYDANFGYRVWEGIAKTGESPVINEFGECFVLAEPVDPSGFHFIGETQLTLQNTIDYANNYFKSDVVWEKLV